MAEAKSKEAKAESKKEEKAAAKAQEKPKEMKKAEAKPKDAKKSKGKKAVYNPWKILKFPHLAEKSMNMVELENKLVFMVERKATRAQIRDAVERGFGVKVTGVNMMITQKGVKKAYIRLAPEHLASDIASRLGMI